jgi:hypothetical protein
MKKRVRRYGHEQRTTRCAVSIKQVFLFLTACKSVIGNEFETGGIKRPTAEAAAAAGRAEGGKNGGCDDDLRAMSRAHCVANR